MGQEDLRVLLEDGRDRHHRHIVGDRIERHQGIGGHEEVDLAGDQEHAVVVVRPARHDGDVEPVFPVGAVGDRLKEAAMLGLGHPVGSERDLVQLLRFVAFFTLFFTLFFLGYGGRDDQKGGQKARC